MKKIGGLRTRWLRNTEGVLLLLGLACVLGVTAAFGFYAYSAMESDLRYRAKTSADFFAECMSRNYSEYYDACIAFTTSFADKDGLQLQFLDADGQLIAASAGAAASCSPGTQEIAEAIETQSIRSYFGRDPNSGLTVLAVSSPMLYASGEVIGVLRYVTGLGALWREVLKVFGISLAVLAGVMLVVYLCGSYFIRSIVLPVDEITQKARRIAAGSYGIQIPKQYDDEIGELAEAVNEMSLQISQNEKLQRDFISSLSHELRTPLTAITGWSETLLSMETLDAETARGVRVISREAKRLTDMVVELLDFTRLQDEHIKLNIRPSDLRAEFEDTVFMYPSRVRQEGIALEYLANDEEIPEIPCDPERMRQVFLNILDNAAKHGADGKRIEASIHSSGDFVTVQIRDFGPGIPEDELPLVKRKFYKGSSKARGTGIGLAVCEEIVTMHSGELILENAPGGGTLVTIRLPVSQ
ncbi:MAG: HAMP domain-containing histidine kinase [Firmicutes bacterium]|nr:HAMP domain-containing histidine kinase [Bacillota bacterium]